MGKMKILRLHTANVIEDPMEHKFGVPSGMPRRKQIQSWWCSGQDNQGCGSKEPRLQVGNSVLMLAEDSKQSVANGGIATDRQIIEIHDDDPSVDERSRINHDGDGDAQASHPEAEDERTSAGKTNKRKGVKFGPFLTRNEEAMLFRICCERKELYGDVGTTNFWRQVSEALKEARNGKSLSRKACKARVAKAMKKREAELGAQTAENGENGNRPLDMRSDSWVVALDEWRAVVENGCQGSEDANKLKNQMASGQNIADQAQYHADQRIPGDRFARFEPPEAFHIPPETQTECSRCYTSRSNHDDISVEFKEQMVELAAMLKAKEARIAKKAAKKEAAKKAIEESQKEQETLLTAGLTEQETASAYVDRITALEQELSGIKSVLADILDAVKLRGKKEVSKKRREDLLMKLQRNRERKREGKYGRREKSKRDGA